jgi:DNA repair protein RadC
MSSRSLRSAPADRFAGLAPHDLTPAETDSLIRLALAALAERHRPGVALGSPEDTRAYLRLMLGERRNEVFGCLLLDNRLRLRAVEELFHGSIDGAAVYPRVVVQRALDTDSAAVILFHCHPSGVAEPSSADEAMTQRLISALGLVDVRVLDHVVVTSQGFVSFAERGLI